MNPAEWKVGISVRFPSSPVWHPGERCVYWSDVESGVLYRMDGATGEAESVFEDGRPIGAITVQADGALLLFRDHGNVVLYRDGAIVETIVPDLGDYRKTRFAGAAADSAGRVVCTVLSDFSHPARCLLLDRDGRLSAFRETVGLPLGVAFGEDGHALYISNAYPARPEVLKFEYDANRPVSELTPVKLIDYATSAKRGSATPAGMAVLTDGSLLAASRDGSEIARFSPLGDRMGGCKLQARRPVGLCFGGDAMRDLYIATAGAHRRQLDGMHAGELAVIQDFHCAGAPAFASRIGLADEEPSGETAGETPEPANL